MTTTMPVNRHLRSTTFTTTTPASLTPTTQPSSSTATATSPDAQSRRQAVQDRIANLRATARQLAAVDARRNILHVDLNMQPPNNDAIGSAGVFAALIDIRASSVSSPTSDASAASVTNARNVTNTSNHDINAAYTTNARNNVYPQNSTNVRDRHRPQSTSRGLPPTNISFSRDIDPIVVRSIPASPASTIVPYNEDHTDPPGRPSPTPRSISPFTMIPVSPYEELIDPHGPPGIWLRLAPTSAVTPSATSPTPLTSRGQAVAARLENRSSVPDREMILQQAEELLDTRLHLRPPFRSSIFTHSATNSPPNQTNPNNPHSNTRNNPDPNTRPEANAPTNAPAFPQSHTAQRQLVDDVDHIIHLIRDNDELADILAECPSLARHLLDGEVDRTMVWASNDMPLDARRMDYFRVMANRRDMSASPPVSVPRGAEERRRERENQRSYRTRIAALRTLWDRPEDDSTELRAMRIAFGARRLEVGPQVQGPRQVNTQQGAARQGDTRHGDNRQGDTRHGDTRQDDAERGLVDMMSTMATEEEKETVGLRTSTGTSGPVDNAMNAHLWPSGPIRRRVRPYRSMLDL